MPKLDLRFPSAESLKMPGPPGGTSGGGGCYVQFIAGTSGYLLCSKRERRIKHACLRHQVVESDHGREPRPLFGAFGLSSVLFSVVVWDGLGLFVFSANLETPRDSAP